MPPYTTPAEQANLAQMREWLERGFVGWDREEVLAYFIAGGGRREEFARYHELQLSDLRDTVRAIDGGTYHSAGAALMYLVAGQKPAG